MVRTTWRPGRGRWPAWGPAAAVLVLAAAACGNPRLDVAVRQPIEFPHARHLAYFSSGQHRTERIRMHLEMFGQTEPPEELAQGRCVECHDDLPARTACAGCHVQSQDAVLRARKDIRTCAGCHRGTWTGASATIPDKALCVACHGEATVQAMREGRQAGAVTLARMDTPRTEMAPEADLPWVQINTVAPNVYFSHAPHVRFGRIACTRCHEDVSGLTAPPSAVRVVSMSECLRCHAETGASTDCLTCHR